ncbi:hypothetical protein BVX95_01360 [archaeon D22]|nr:hypothetical protein BVX95_01360 [archaeon D22]
MSEAKRNRGRPKGSLIRQNIIEILYFMDEGYGYDIHKIYKDIFGAVAQKSIYYNLNKGLTTEEFLLKEVKKETGDYSWGSTVEKHIYVLGPNAKAQVNSLVKDYFDKKNK